MIDRLTRTTIYDAFGSLSNLIHVLDPEDHVCVLQTLASHRCRISMRFLSAREAEAESSLHWPASYLEEHPQWHIGSAKLVH